MAIDSSIYQGVGDLKQVEMPSFADSAQKAMSLSQLAMQNRAAQQQMATGEAVRALYAKNTGSDGNLNQGGFLSDLGKVSPESAMKYQEHFAKMGKEGADAQAAKADAIQKTYNITGPAFDYMAGMPEDQRAAAYPRVIEQLKGQGVDTSKMEHPYDPGLFRQYYGTWQQNKEAIANQLTKTNIEHVGAETAKVYSEIGKEKRGKPLAAEQTDRLAGHDASFKQLDDLESAVKSNGDIMGPYAGRISSLNPYNTRAQSLQALVGAAAQKVGKSLEGGKLTDADIDRYKKMLPTNTDTPDVAMQKIGQVRRMVAQQQSSDVDTFGRAGSDVSKFSPVATNDIAIIKKQKKGSGSAINSAYAAPPAVKPGTEEDGHIFMGGDPGEATSWKRAR